MWLSQPRVESKRQNDVIPTDLLSGLIMAMSTNNLNQPPDALISINRRVSGQVYKTLDEI